MSQPNRTKTPAQSTSTETVERRKPTRAELLRRAYRADLRDAINEARELVHFNRVPVGA
jgi:hypothetical protein